MLLYCTVPACPVRAFGDCVQPQDPRGRPGRSQMSCVGARRQQVASLLNPTYGPAGGWMGYVWCQQSQPAPAGVTWEGRGQEQHHGLVTVSVEHFHKWVGFEESCIRWRLRVHCPAAWQEQRAMNLQFLSSLLFPLPLLCVCLHNIFSMSSKMFSNML